MDHEIIASSELFDAKWYSEKYDVKRNQALHYLNIGWKKKYNPSAYFSTESYLDTYVDVANAGMCPLLHYEIFGKKEKRLDRFRKITGKCNLVGKGLEIGPSFNPLCPKSKGYDVEIIDHLDQAGLRKKYENDPGVNTLIGNIEPVDYVWSGEDYRDLTGKENYYDYIIASHLFEHTTDLIGFFDQCSALLKDNGILALAVPNKHYCFDFFRENTSLSEVIAKHDGNVSEHMHNKIKEYFSSIVTLDQKISWNQALLETNQNFAFLYKKDDVEMLSSGGGGGILLTYMSGYLHLLLFVC